MARPIRRVNDVDTTRPGVASLAAGYPSLKEHLSTRRRFLGIAGATGATVAASGLLAACHQGLGNSPDPDAAAPRPDARPNGPDANIEMPGEAPYPDYFTMRIPATGETSAYLVDGGYATFHVELVTYVEASYLALLDHLGTAEDRCRTAVADYTYDTLNTAAGVASAEEDVQDALDALCMELGGHQDPTLEAVTLTISYLEPYAPIDGGMPEPSYP